MTSYLDGGWYVPQTRSRLRTEVIDGAMDIAGMLVRAGVPARRLLRLALKVRTLVVIADPLMRGTSRFAAAERANVAERLANYTDDFPALQGFVNDCIEQVNGAPDMTAFYLHLVHVARMMQLLDHAVHRGIAASGKRRREKAEKSRKTAAKKTSVREKKTQRTKTAKKSAGRKKKTGKKPAGKKKTGRKKAARRRVSGPAPGRKRPPNARKPVKKKKKRSSRKR
jgi:hypothetical protein